MEFSPGDLRTPERRVVRRKLIQSTLFPHKPQEQREGNGDQKVEKVCGDDEDGEDEECCGSQSKKKRNPKEKAMPQTRASKKSKAKQAADTTPKTKRSADTTPKRKRSAGTTPKKTLTNLIECEGASLPIPDLRLEAKMSAEENSRMFAGKQIHPFFSSRKVDKKNSEVTEVEGTWCLVGRKNKGITCGPIHVFERTQDDAALLDWRNWTFCEDTFANANHGLENKLSLVYEGSDGSLHIDKLPIVLHPCDASTFHNEVSLDRCLSQQEHSHEVDYKVDNVGLFSGHTGCLGKSDFEQQSRFLQERMMSYYLGFDNQHENSLWTYKHKPKKAMEVCGNDESVKFMNDWLHIWRERNFQISKDPNDGDKYYMQDDDYNCFRSDSESENIDKENSLKNVLLVTGPVGSGKSAAIYACAEEQGFEVLELSASDCRNGALVKQKFGEALESHRLKRSLEHRMESQNNHIVKSPPVLPNGEAAQEFDNEVVEVIPLSDEEAPHDDIKVSENFVGKENGTACDQGEIKPLILFEDVDITFLEDRGFIAAIQQIAETAKGPMILTSNNINPVLPDSLDRLQVCFTLPSSKELLCHIYMVCAAEKANIQPHLLERLVGSCHGDIRKIIMHLQFWCQGKRVRQGRKVQRTYGSLLFDVEAGHQILPKIIPWEFPSQLSELVEEEITKSLFMMEENSSLMEVVEEEELDEKEMHINLDIRNSETDGIEAKKIAMLNMNGSVQDCNEFTAQFDTACELSNSSGSPVAFSRRNVRRKLDVLLSSDSEDEFLNNGYPVILGKDINNVASPEVNNSFLSHCPLTQCCLSPLTDKLVSAAENLKEKCCQCSQTADDLHVNETCKSFDVSCVPESSFVPETVIDNVTESSKTVSCGHVADTLEVSLSDELIQNLLPVESDYLDKPLRRLHKTSEMLDNTYDVNPESSHGEEVKDSQDEQVEAMREYQVMDECSRMDFSRRSKLVETPRSFVLTDLVQESWKKLRGCHTDLKQYVVSEQKDVIQIVKLASDMSNLISEADLLLSKCQLVTSDSLEPSLVPSEGPDALSWYDEQMHMTSTISQHGFCFYAKAIAAVGSNMGCESSVDLASEMLASTSNMMALGKLIGLDMRTCRILNATRGLEMSPPKSDSSRSEVKSSIFDIIHSLIPAKSYLALRDVAFCEYLSSLCHISRSETSRLSEAIGKTRRRRGRAARHYLSTGALMLSPEDISFLGQYNFNGKISSQQIDSSLR